MWKKIVNLLCYMLSKLLHIFRSKSKMNNPKEFFRGLKWVRLFGKKSKFFTCFFIIPSLTVFVTWLLSLLPNIQSVDKQEFSQISNLLIYLFHFLDSKNEIWVPMVIYIASSLLSYLLVSGLYFSAIDKRDEIIVLYQKKSIIFSMLAKYFIDDRLETCVEFWTSAQQSDQEATISKSDLIKLQLGLSQVVDVIKPKTSCLTTTVDVKKLDKLVLEFQEDDPKNSITNIKRFFVIRDDFEKIFNLNNYSKDETTTKYLKAFVNNYNPAVNPNAKLYYIKFERFQMCAEKCDIKLSRSDCAMFDNEFIFGIKLEELNSLDFEMTDDTNFKIFTVHGKQRDKYGEFFTRLEKVCKKEATQESGLVYTALDKYGLVSSYQES